MKIKLTEKQRELLDELTEKPEGGIHLNGGRLSTRPYSMISTARSLEKRGMINIMVDEYADYYAYWDDEFRADWVRAIEEEYQEAAGKGGQNA